MRPAARQTTGGDRWHRGDRWGDRWHRGDRWQSGTHERGDGGGHDQQADETGTDSCAFHASTVPTLRPTPAQGVDKTGATNHQFTT